MKNQKLINPLLNNFFNNARHYKTDKPYGLLLEFILTTLKNQERSGILHVLVAEKQSIKDQQVAHLVDKISKNQIFDIY